MEKLIIKRKHYSSAPLPFQGQKRRFVKEFKEAIKEFNGTSIFIDLFGGSGLLSHLIKSVRPDAEVIYNDYDDYHIRLKNVHKTNALLAELRKLCQGLPVDKKIPEPAKYTILKLIEKEDQSGYVDYITISSSLLFSMNYANNLEQLKKNTMYNCVRTSDYNCEGYLDGLKVVKFDYLELYNMYKDIPGVVFIVDPPYLSTDAGTYKSYWRLKQYLDVLKVLKGTSYFYFTSNKSSIVELCEWMEENLNASNPFRNAHIKEHTSRMSYATEYVDIMMYKKAA